MPGCGNRLHNLGIFLPNAAQNKKSGFAAGVAAKLQQQVHIGPEIGSLSAMGGKVHAIIVGVIPIFNIKGKNIGFGHYTA